MRRSPRKPHPHVADEVSGESGTHKTEGEARVRRVGSAGFPSLPDAREKVVRRKGEGARGVDLVDEHDDPLGGGFGIGGRVQGVREEAEDAAGGRSLLLQRGDGSPPRAQRAAQLDEQPRVPLFGRGSRRSDARDVDERRPDARLQEPPHRPYRERGLAHLAGVQNVAELAREEALVQLAVGGALDVGRCAYVVGRGRRLA